MFELTDALAVGGRHVFGQNVLNSRIKPPNTSSAPLSGTLADYGHHAGAEASGYVFGHSKDVMLTDPASDHAV